MSYECNIITASCEVLVCMSVHRKSLPIIDLHSISPLTTCKIAVLSNHMSHIPELNVNYAYNMFQTQADMHMYLICFKQNRTLLEKMVTQ